jgi:hypothetical protein
VKNTMTARKTSGKKTPEKTSARVVTGVAKGIKNIAPEDIEAIRENPSNIWDVVFDKATGILLDGMKSEDVSKPPTTNKPSSKPNSPATARNNQQQKTQQELVSCLRDGNQYGLDDLLRYWQDFVDPGVDWLYETRKQSQPELASRLVKQATRKGKLQELAKIVLPRQSSGRPRNRKQSQRSKK